MSLSSKLFIASYAIGSGFGTIIFSKFLHREYQIYNEKYPNDPIYKKLFVGLTTYGCIIPFAMFSAPFFGLAGPITIPMALEKLKDE